MFWGKITWSSHSIFATQGFKMLQTDQISCYFDLNMAFKKASWKKLLKKAQILDTQTELQELIHIPTRVPM